MRVCGFASLLALIVSVSAHGPRREGCVGKLEKRMPVAEGRFPTGAVDAETVTHSMRYSLVLSLLLHEFLSRIREKGKHGRDSR